MNAPPAPRSYDTVQLAVGMTSIPVSVFTETTTETNTVLASPDGNPVGNKHYDKVTGEILERDQVISMTQTKHGPVWVDKAEVEAALDLPAKSITIHSFHPVDHLAGFKVRGYRSIEPAQIGTKKGKRDRPHAQQQLSALLAGMANRGVLAYGEFVTRNRVYPVALLPDGQMLELHYEQNVRARRESKLVDPPSEMLAETEALIDRLMGAAEPDLNDRRREALATFAEVKAETTNPVESLMADLQASIDRQKAKVA